MTNKVSDLRAILFETIGEVRAGKVSLDVAKTVADLTQVVVNSAKVEVDFIRATNGKGVASGFLGEQPDAVPELPAPDGRQPGPGAQPASGDLPPGITGVHRHRISDQEPGGEAQ